MIFVFFAAFETWHNSEACPNLIACTPSGYRCIEKARGRSAKDNNNVKTNHGGVCLFYKACYVVRRIKLPSYKSFEMLGVQVHGASINLLIVIYYHPGSSPVNSILFDEFADVIERLAVFSAPCRWCEYSPGWCIGGFNISLLWHSRLRRLSSARRRPDASCRTYTGCCNHTKSYVCVCVS